ncbi:hypothetical protein BpHYR1_026926 [Brachionus plicatilis]|uniref:Uncharacterized protein n=1 Tax=Brachionus plicatilis TaxID=10195 RepID=A0A3M7T4Q5_BRAPC|nr:hypothetical protein BpHYR1_026926 [Brachionus plicatilis]
MKIKISNESFKKLDFINGFFPECQINVIYTSNFEKLTLKQYLLKPNDSFLMNFSPSLQSFFKSFSIKDKFRKFGLYKNYVKNGKNTIIKSSLHKSFDMKPDLANLKKRIPDLDFFLKL